MSVNRLLLLMKTASSQSEGTVRNDQPWVVASSKAERVEADDAVMADQRGITTRGRGKITTNVQIRERVERRHDTWRMCKKGITWSKPKGQAKLIITVGWRIFMHWKTHTHPFYCRDHCSLSQTPNSADFSLREFASRRCTHPQNKASKSLPHLWCSLQSADTN